MQHDVIQEIELHMDEAKSAIAKADALERLFSNPDFKEVIVDGYFEKEAIRLVHLKGDPSMQDETRQANLIKEMDGIGSLKGYISAVFRQAEMAQRSIEDDEAELEMLRNEGAEE